MTFRFKKWSNPDVADFAFELPEIPRTTSFDFRSLIDTYCNAVASGPEAAEEDAFAQVSGFSPTSVSDLIAKYLITLHYNHRGIDGGRMVLAVTQSKANAIPEAESILTDMYAVQHRQAELKAAVMGVDSLIAHVRRIAVLVRAVTNADTLDTGPLQSLAEEEAAKALHALSIVEQALMPPPVAS